MNLIKLIYIIVKIALILVPAIKCLPKPKLTDLMKVFKLIYPYLKHIKLGMVSYSQLVRVYTWLANNQSLIVRLAKLCSSIVEFVTKLINLLTSALTKLVTRVVSVASRVVNTTKNILLTKLW